MAEIDAKIEIRHDNNPQNRIMRMIEARLFSLDGCTDMIKIANTLSMIPDQKPETTQMMMEINQLRDLLGQLGYGLMRREDAQEIIQRYNEDADTPRCPECGHEMERAEGYRCGGYACPECWHEDADNTYY